VRCLPWPLCQGRAYYAGIPRLKVPYDHNVMLGLAVAYLTDT
jgi:hypothetical protein